MQIGLKLIFILRKAWGGDDKVPAMVLQAKVLIWENLPSVPLAVFRFEDSFCKQKSRCFTRNIYRNYEQ
jgi:hypothetical protein